MMNRRVKSRPNSKGPINNNMNRSIMMRKYGLDESQAYVEQSTLLEPNNFIPSWEAGGEEKKEVSQALRKLRLKYDGIHKHVRAKEDQLEMIKKGVEKIGLEEHKVEQDTGGTQQETEQAKTELAQIKFHHDFEMLYQNQYQHMLDRMKKDLIALQLYSNDLMESLRSKRTIMKDELTKQRKSKENKLQSKYRLDHLMKNIDHEQKKRQERILSLQTSIKNKEEALQKRMDRVRRQSEIAEAAANENKDTNEIKLRENFMSQNLWSQFFKKKMANEMAKSYQVENAFQKIKAQTGMSDVQEIVHKFLTREQTYSHLLRAVGENEKKLEYLRIQNEKKRKELQQLQINFNALQQQNIEAGIIQTTDKKEVLQMEQEVAFLEKELENVNEKKKKINLVGDQVGGWANKVILKLNNQDNIQFENSTKKKSILELFNQITHIVNGQLEDIINQQEVNEEDKSYYITAKDFMNDFVTEEFLTKNIRVRPISGITGKDADDNKSERMSRNNFIAEPADDEEKFNKMINLEMEDQRKKQKLKREEIERKKQLEAEKLAKAHQAKKK